MTPPSKIDDQMIAPSTPPGAEAIPPDSASSQLDLNDFEDGRGELDLNDRVLCPDGECVGVIGPDGKCKVCGTARDDNKQGCPSSEIAAGRESNEGDMKDPAEPVELPQDGTDPLDFANRKLCTNGECIGIIGKDGLCRDCGNPYTGEI